MRAVDCSLLHTMQHDATCFNTLQRTATHCSTLQHTAAHCSTLQHNTTRCNMLQHTTALCSTRAMTYMAPTCEGSLIKTSSKSSSTPLTSLTSSSPSPSMNWKERKRTHLHERCVRHCDTLQHNSPNHTVSGTKALQGGERPAALNNCASVLQCVAVCCSVLQSQRGETPAALNNCDIKKHAADTTCRSNEFVRVGEFVRFR